MKFADGQKVIIHYKDARGVVTAYEGEIVGHVKDSVYRCTMGGFGLWFLIPEGDIQDAENKTENQGGQTGGGASNNARV